MTHGTCPCGHGGCYQWLIDSRHLFLLVSLLFLAACSSFPARQDATDSIYLGRPGQLGHCAGLFAEVDRRIRSSAAQDYQSHRLAGFPYLRSNRFLASFTAELNEAGQVADWLQAMRGLDREARSYELMNSAGTGEAAGITAELDACAGIMMQEDRQDAARLQRIREEARVPDNYRLLNRVAGLYPLSGLLVKAGVKRLHRAIRHDFSSQPGDLRAAHPVQVVAPANNETLGPGQVRALIDRSGRNPLSIPRPAEDDAQRLFGHFAPVWEIETASHADKPGAMYWQDAEGLAVDTSKPRVYQHLSHTRLHGRSLLQLNYTIWFPSRPARNRLDLLAGKLAGLTFRVTLDSNGRPLMYDSMHNCGCYHMFFPASQAGASRLPLDDGEEPLLVPAQVSTPGEGERLHIRLASGTHYIRGLYTAVAADGSRTYQVADYNSLRSLPRGNGTRRSMFGVNGIVPGSERLERWLLWPMGVESAGAMRQWGNHATAFIGRRHFDDADLLERYFSFSH